MRSPAVPGTAEAARDVPVNAVVNAVINAVIRGGHRHPDAAPGDPVILVGIARGQHHTAVPASGLQRPRR